MDAVRKRGKLGWEMVAAVINPIVGFDRLTYGNMRQNKRGAFIFCGVKERGQRVALLMWK